MKYKILFLEIPEEYHKALKRIKKEKGISMTHIIRSAIKRYLKRNKEK